MTAIVLQTDAPPFRDDGAGGLRLGESRVLVELVLEAFQDGATPETIVQRYPTTNLADVYSAIGYYLRHRQELDDYLKRREAAGEVVREKIASRQSDLSTVRERLLAHR